MTQSDRSIRAAQETQPELESKIVFALAIPTTADWMSERAASLAKLHDMLGSRPKFYREFRDRAPNWVWSRDLWRWGAAMAAEGATHLVQLQDDVRPMPHFWPVLRAMVEANPQRWIGLQVNHPHARQLFHQGRRWFKTRAWMVGCQYVAPLTGNDSLDRFLEWLDTNPMLPDDHPEKLTQFEQEHEDVAIGAWLAKTGRDLWHPIPAIADVDLTIGSTYEQTAGHIDDHRRPTVTWEVQPAEMLATRRYWEVPGFVEHVGGPGPGPCSSCGKLPGLVRFDQFIKLCSLCWIKGQANLIGVRVGTQGGAT